MWVNGTHSQHDEWLSAVGSRMYWTVERHCGSRSGQRYEQPFGWKCECYLKNSFKSLHFKIGLIIIKFKSASWCKSGLCSDFACSFYLFIFAENSHKKHIPILILVECWQKGLGRVGVWEIWQLESVTSLRRSINMRAHCTWWPCPGGLTHW